MMKYIPSMETNQNIQEKIEYLKRTEDFVPINVRWLLGSVEKLSALIAESKCATCNEVSGEHWFAAENQILCQPCFDIYRDSLTAD